MRIWNTLLGIFLLGACTWSSSGERGKAQDESRPDLLPVPKELAAPVVAAAGSPTPWPADALDGVHGWLAIHSGTPGNPPPWGAIQGSQPAVLLDPSWSAPKGTTLGGLVPGGRVPFTTGAKETVRFGCDGGHPVEKITPLQGLVSPGLVWMVSPTFGDAAGLAVVTADAENSRTWTAGKKVLGLTKTGAYTAELWQDTPTQVVKTFNVAENLMDGFEAQPVELKEAFMIPQVSAAWKVGDSTVWGLYWNSLEGVHFEAFIHGNPGSMKEIGYLYRCGF